MNLFLLLSLEDAVVDVREDVVAAFEGGQPFGADVVAAKGFVDCGEVAKRVFRLIAGVFGGVLPVKVGRPI